MKDIVPRTVVLNSPTRQPLLRYLGSLSSVHYMSKRINYVMNAFLLPEHALNGSKIIKKVKGRKKSRKGQPITIRNVPRDNQGTPCIKAFTFYFHHSTSRTHSIKKRLRSSSTLSHYFRGLSSSHHHKNAWLDDLSVRVWT